VPPDHEAEERYGFDNAGFSRQPSASTRPHFGGQRRDSSFWTEVARERANLDRGSQQADEAASPSQFEAQGLVPNQAKEQMKMQMPAAKGAGYQDERGASRLPPLRVLGQIHKTFLVCEGPDGLYLIDQHTAHERILLERFQRERARQAVPSQRLLTPLTLELTPQQIALVEEQEDLLLSLGFEIAPFGGLMVQVRALPNLIQHHPDPAAALAEILDGTIADRSGLSWEDRLVMYAACRGAVKAGDLLKLDEMEDLIRQLERTDLSRTCAHGRPTVVRLSHQQLEREFGRR
jgi:DNA mismatch repair protein MutL